MARCRWTQPSAPPWVEMSLEVFTSCWPGPAPRANTRELNDNSLPQGLARGAPVPNDPKDCLGSPTPKSAPAELGLGGPGILPLHSHCCEGIHSVWPPSHRYKKPAISPPNNGATQKSQSWERAAPPTNKAGPVLRAGLTDRLSTGIPIK